MVAQQLTHQTIDLKVVNLTLETHKAATAGLMSKAPHFQLGICIKDKIKCKCPFCLPNGINVNNIYYYNPH